MTSPVRQHDRKRPPSDAPDPGRAAARAYRALFLPLTLFYLVLGASERVALWTAFRADAGFDAGDLPLALVCGLATDSTTLVFLLLPLTLMLVALPRGLRNGRAGRATLEMVLFTCVAAALFVAVAEFLFFDEFEARFNLVAVDYLIYPTEVVGNIAESYPTGWLLAAIGAAAAAIAAALWPSVRDALGEPPPLRRRLVALAAHLAIAVVLAISVALRRAVVRDQPRHQRARHERRVDVLPRAAHGGDRL